MLTKRDHTSGLRPTMGPCYIRNLCLYLSSSVQFSRRHQKLAVNLNNDAVPVSVPFCLAALLGDSAGDRKRASTEQRKTFVLGSEQVRIRTINPKASTTPRTNGTIPPQNAEHEVDTCGKVDLFVQFADLGFNTTLIYPRASGFNAYQCKGECSATQRKKFSNRSLLMALMEKKKGLKTAREVCCVPTKLRPLSVLYFHPSNEYLLQKTFDGMVVEECGCE